MSDASCDRISLVDAAPSRTPFSPLLAIHDRRERSIGNGPAVRDDAFTLGFLAGRREAGEQFDEERRRLLALIATAESLQPEPSEELVTLIAETIETLVRRIVGETVIDGVQLRSRIKRAAAIISEADATQTLWLNPDDLALVAGADFPLEARPDPEIERGGLRIDCSGGWIEDGRSPHLTLLRTELGMEDPA